MTDPRRGTNPFHRSTPPLGSYYNDQGSFDTPPNQSQTSGSWATASHTANIAYPPAANTAVPPPPTVTTHNSTHYNEDEDDLFIDPATLQYAMPPQIHQTRMPPSAARRNQATIRPPQSFPPPTQPLAAVPPPLPYVPPDFSTEPSTTNTGSVQEVDKQNELPETPLMHEFESGASESQSQAQNYFDTDDALLTASAEPIAGASQSRCDEERDSFGTASFYLAPAVGSHLASTDGNRSRIDVETGGGKDRHRVYGTSLMPQDSRSGALHRAGNIVRAISQRVVKMSGEGEIHMGGDRRSRAASRSSSPVRRSGSVESRPPLPTRIPSDISGHRVDTSYPSQLAPETVNEKAKTQTTIHETLQPVDSNNFNRQSVSSGQRPLSNPLKGKSLGIFGPENPVRKLLFEFLVLPFTEPLIFFLIVAQVILLILDTVQSFYKPNLKLTWGTPQDWAMVVLFALYTIEVLVRIIVSGLILNAPEYSTIDRKKGVRAALNDKYNAVFQPHRTDSLKATAGPVVTPSALVRSFTVLHPQAEAPETFEEQQRLYLARRAFLRHSFNRLDFVAIVSFWCAFALTVGGHEQQTHVNVLNMLSCLRVLRLLALTNGTAVILRSMKKAAPLLARVAFLLGFFWLVFAIIGIQSFKSSLKRTCLWVDPAQPENISAAWPYELQFCGGHLDVVTGQAMPWMRANPPNTLLNLEAGAPRAKGYICPRGSLCLERNNPYNGTVNFDDIVHSLELVFVIMSANTWSTIMYWTANSDYLASALFFAAGIVIMMLWLTNLLIAVITTSFQVIREEQRGSAFTGDEDGLKLERDRDGRLQSIGGMGRPPMNRMQTLYERTWWLWVFLIAFDLFAHGFRSSRMTARTALFIDVVEIVVTGFLDIEILLRAAADRSDFLRKKRDIVDAGLAIINTIILIPPIRYSGTPYAWLTFFQIVRIYRVVLAVPMTRKLILQVLGNAMGIANLMLFVFLLTFIMSLFAVQLFRGLIPLNDSDGTRQRVTFESLFNAFQGMYQIFSSENWTEILYSVTGQVDPSRRTSWISAIFLIGWFTLAYFIVLNMFVAVIQENFDVSEDEKRVEQVKAFVHRRDLGHASNLTLASILGFNRPGMQRYAHLDQGAAMMEMLLKDAVFRDFVNDSDGDNAMRESTEEQPTSPPLREGEATSQAKLGPLAAARSRIRQFFAGQSSNPFYSNMEFTAAHDGMDAREMARLAVNANAARRQAQREYLLRHPTYNNSLYIFTPRNPIRRCCQQLVGPGRGTERFDGVLPNRIAWNIFSIITYTAVVAMVIIACITTPRYQREYRQNHPSVSLYGTWFIIADLVFAAIFTLESIVRVIADGAIWTPNAYYRSSWGIIDGVVLATLWISLIATLVRDGDSVSRAIGAFKALRALRLLYISASARDTLHSMVIGIGKLLSAAFVSISLLIPFALYGVNLFMDRMRACNDDGSNITNLVQCYGEYPSTPFKQEWGVLAPRSASNDYFNFDNFGAALFTLFQIVSQEGWIDVSYAAQAITGEDLQPQFGAAQGNAVFFIAFNLLGTVFILTLFLSVFMRNYTEQTGVAFLTAEQRSWLELRKMLRQISPSKSSHDKSMGKFKKWCLQRATKKRGRWYQAITLVLVLHLILLLLEYHKEPKQWRDARSYILFVFVLIYLVNVVVRIIGLGWSRFRRSSWDMYSLIVVTGAFATSILLRTDPDRDTYIQCHKIFLVAIVGLLIPRNDALDQLFKTAAASLTSIANLMTTWFVFYIVFAVALTQSFSLTRFGTAATNRQNFRNVPHALIMLFRFSAGEGWNQVMEDFAQIRPPLCVYDDRFFESDCGSESWARLLFVLWNIISMYIFVSLFVSLIYESFSYVYQRHSGVAAVDRDEIRRFKEAWRRVDPAGTGFISKEDFPRLLGELSGIFEMRIYDHQDSVRRILEDVRGTTHAGPASAHSYLDPAGSNAKIDLQRLNKRIARIDTEQVRARRRRFKIFYEEMMVAAYPDRGISFTTVLLTLAHYKIINDNKSLRLEEYLKRRHTLQRVEEEVRRQIVRGFFETLYERRQFRKRFPHVAQRPTVSLSPCVSVRSTMVPEVRVGDRSIVSASPNPSTNGGNRAQRHASTGAALDTTSLRARPSLWARRSKTTDGQSRLVTPGPHQPMETRTVTPTSLPSGSLASYDGNTLDDFTTHLSSTSEPVWDGYVDVGLDSYQHPLDMPRGESSAVVKEESYGTAPSNSLTQHAVPHLTAPGPSSSGNPFAESLSRLNRSSSNSNPPSAVASPFRAPSAVLPPSIYVPGAGPFHFQLQGFSDGPQTSTISLGTATASRLAARGRVPGLGSIATSVPMVHTQPPSQSYGVVTPDEATGPSSFISASPTSYNPYDPQHQQALYNSSGERGTASRVTYESAEYHTAVDTFSTPTHRRGTKAPTLGPTPSAQLREMLDDSAWVESIRRSATLLKTRHGTHSPDHGRSGPFSTSHYPHSGGGSGAAMDPSSKASGGAGAGNGPFV